MRPHCIIYEPVSKLLYVTTEIEKTVTIIDPKTMKIVERCPPTRSGRICWRSATMAAADMPTGQGTVSVLDLAGRKFVKTIYIAATTEPVSISNDDRMVFTSDQTVPQMAVIDTATNED